MELAHCSRDRIVLNDAYSASPDSIAAALCIAVNLTSGQHRCCPGARTMAVLGDMFELGPESGGLHAKAGALATDLGVDGAITVGEHAGIMTETARERGIEVRAVTRGEASRVDLVVGDLPLVKGSCSVGLELVADAVTKRVGDIPE